FVSECESRRRNVVFHRFGNADRAKSLSAQFEGNAQSVRASECTPTDNGNDRIDLLPTDFLEQLIGAVYLLDIIVRIDCADSEWIDSGSGAEDAAARSAQVLDDLRSKLDQPSVGIVVSDHEAIVAIVNSDDLPTQSACGKHGAGNDRIQPRHITAAAVDRDALRFQS